MKRAVLFSLALHIVLIAMVWVDVTWFVPEPVVTPPGQISVVLKPLPPRPPEKVVEKPKSRPKPVVQQPPKPDPRPEPAPKPKPRLEPKPKPAPKPVPVPSPQPKAQARPQPPSPPQPPPQPQMRPQKPEKTAAEQAAEDQSLLKTLAETVPEESLAAETEQDHGEDSTEFLEQLVDRTMTQVTPAAGERGLSNDEFDALRRQLAQCWSIPSGAVEAEDLRVSVLVDLRPDATVITARLQNDGAPSNNRFYNIAAESALRALRDPFCERLALPLDKYDVWRQMILVFDPQQMF